MAKDKLIDLLVEGAINVDDFYNLANATHENSGYNILGLSSDEYELFCELGKESLEDIKKAHVEKNRIIEKAKAFFKEEIAENHRKNTEKLKDIRKFNLNPFLDKYKANFLTGSSDPESIAKALVYPRVLGTSINTTFGTKLQKFCSTVLEGYASTTSGIDIEFNDLVDGRRKYCQVKAGPNTINKDDVKTIEDHFVSIKNLARTNNLSIGFNDLVVGVFYGDQMELSVHYKTIQKKYPVHIGRDFWNRLTGDDFFYSRLTNAIGEVASEYDGSQLIRDVIKSLSKEIEKIMED